MACDKSIVVTGSVPEVMICQAGPRLFSKEHGGFMDVGVTLEGMMV